MTDLLDLKINEVSYPMVYVKPGAFRMGEDDNFVDIKFKKGYYIGKYLVTQRLWTSIMGNNPSRFQFENHPVETILWDDICQKDGFLEQLNASPQGKQLYRNDGLQFRLPSEAQWEYAARGGAKSNGFLYSGSQKLKEVGWYYKNSSRQTKPIGLKLPNELDLYDMSGNVREWCADHWHGNLNDTPKDGSAWLAKKTGFFRRVFSGDDATRRVVRGGSWVIDDDYCRVSYRLRFITVDWDYYIGFRVARY